jgi:hypothetical protein
VPSLSAGAYSSRVRRNVSALPSPCFSARSSSYHTQGSGATDQQHQRARKKTYAACPATPDGVGLQQCSIEVSAVQWVIGRTIPSIVTLPLQGGATSPSTKKAGERGVLSGLSAQICGASLRLESLFSKLPFNLMHKLSISAKMGRSGVIVLPIQPPIPSPF